MIALTLLLAAAAGVATWSFLEYVIHRWLGHSRKVKTDFGSEHLSHHRDSNYFAPTIKKALTATPVLALAFGAAWLLVGWEHAAAYTLGFGTFYTLYEVVHRRIHTHAPKHRYARFVRRHHLYHHFHSARSNHGVTSHIWDVVFGTYAPAEQVTIPARKAMVWLLNEEGQVREPYREDYVLRGQGRSKKKKGKAPEGAVSAAA